MPPKKSVKKTSTSTVVKPVQNKTLFNIKNTNMKLFKLVETLSKNINSLQTTQDTFNSNFTNLKDFSQDQLNEMDYQLKLHTEECDNQYNETLKQYNDKMNLLDNEYSEKKYQMEQEYLRKTDDVERKLKDQEYELASKVVQSYNKIIINNDNYETLNEQIETSDKRFVKLKTELEEKNKKELHSALNTMKLQHQVNSSNMTATIEQQNKEILRLEDTIQTLKQEIQAQRKLTESVANAGQKSVTQNFGK
jgi:hypothetical protein